MVKRTIAVVDEYDDPRVKVPLKFIRKLEAMGLPMVKSAVLYSDTELEAAGPVWEKFVQALEDVRGVYVDVAVKVCGRPGDPLYKTPKGTDHWDEAYRILRARLPEGYTSSRIRYSDAAEDIHAVVRELVDPSESHTLLHGAPEGVYLISLQLFFRNLWFCIRINRKRNFV